MDPNLTFQHYTHLLATPLYITVILNTLKLSVTVTLFCLMLGYPVSYLLVKLKSPIRKLFLVMVILPFLTSTLVRSYSWTVVLGREGLVNKLLQTLGLISSPLELIHNTLGAHIGMIHIMLPIMVLVLFDAMRTVDKESLKAAQTLGASRVRVFSWIFFPLTFYGIASGSVLVFILSLGFFITPALLGGRQDVMISMLIERQANHFLNWGFASALGVFLLCVTSIVFLGFGRFGTIGGIWSMPRSKDPTSGEKTFEHHAGEYGTYFAALHIVERIWTYPRRCLTGRLADAGLAVGSNRNSKEMGVRSAVAVIMRRRPWRINCVYVFAGLVLCFLTFPVVLVIPMSLSSALYMTFPPPGFSLQWYYEFFSSREWNSATLFSFKVATLTALLSTLLGTMASFGLVRGTFRGKGLLYAYILSPLIIPAILLAIADYFFFAHLRLVGSTAAFVLAHTVLAMPYVVIVVSATLMGMDRRLEQAAMTLGANGLRVFFHITLPIISAGLLSGAFLAFVSSFDEAVIALFLSGAHAITLPKKMWDGIRYEVNPTILAVSSCLIGLAVVLMLSLELWGRRSRGLLGERGRGESVADPSG